MEIPILGKPHEDDGGGWLSYQANPLETPKPLFRLRYLADEKLLTGNQGLLAMVMALMVNWRGSHQDEAFRKIGLRVEWADEYFDQEIDRRESEIESRQKLRVVETRGEE